MERLIEGRGTHTAAGNKQTGVNHTGATSPREGSQAGSTFIHGLSSRKYNNSLPDFVTLEIQ